MQFSRHNIFLNSFSQKKEHWEWGHRINIFQVKYRLTKPYRVEPDLDHNFVKNSYSVFLKFGKILVGKLYLGKTCSAELFIDGRFGLSFKIADQKCSNFKER